MLHALKMWGLGIWNPSRYPTPALSEEGRRGAEADLAFCEICGYRAKIVAAYRGLSIGGGGYWNTTYWLISLEAPDGSRRTCNRVAENYLPAVGDVVRLGMWQNPSFPNEAPRLEILGLPYR